MHILFGVIIVYVFTAAFCLGKGKGGKGSPKQNAQGSPGNAGAKSGLKWICDNF